jgi:hypothetical protein
VTELGAQAREILQLLQVGSALCQCGGQGQGDPSATPGRSALCQS